MWFGSVFVQFRSFFFFFPCWKIILCGASGLFTISVSSRSKSLEIFFVVSSSVGRGDSQVVVGGWVVVLLFGLVW